jgi:glycosyltransferase involved in cell wall biosynthesis
LTPPAVSKPAVLSVFGISPTKIGGQEAFARELSAQLGDVGWRSILCFEQIPRDPVLSYLSLPNVSLEVLERPEEAGLRAMRTLGAIIRRHRPDILHLYYTGFLGPYPWLARFCSVRRVFFTDQSSRPAFYVPRRAPVWKRALARVINKPMSTAICVSEYGRRCLTTLDLLPPDRIAMIYNAVDHREEPPSAAAATRFRQRYGIPETRSVLTQVSWLIPEKGILDLLEATRLVLDKRDTVHLVLVGEGAHAEKYAQRARQLGMEQHVTWTGLVQDPVREGVYAAADVVCQMSHWEEVFGYVIAEAMLCGKPVVATRVGGIPEVVHDGVTGLLVPRGDTTRMAETILQLLDDPALRDRLGRAGREIAQAEFNLAKNVKQLLGLYGVL